jgi:IS30 family transposase
VLNKTGNTQAEIAAAVGTSQPTISRELRRNSGLRGYRHQQAQKTSENRRLQATRSIKMTAKAVQLIESKLRLKWSPDQISGWLKKANNVLISYETVYRHIWRDKQAGGELYRHLRRKGKRYQSRSQSNAGRGHIKNRVSIDERPVIVDEKSRVGDWEIDLVIGKGHSGALVTIVERATSFTVSKRVNSKSADVVTAATISLLTPYKAAVLTITADNGKEFAYHEEMTETLDAAVYFADPYCSWQRGLNENTNGLLRQYWPKNTDFKQVPPSAVISVITSLNNRPRKKLNYQTPAKKMAEHMAALAA